MGRQARWRPSQPGGGAEFLAGLPGQPERVSQQTHRSRLGSADPAALQLPDGTRAHPRPLGKLLLGQ